MKRLREKVGGKLQGIALAGFVIAWTLCAPRAKCAPQSNSNAGKGSEAASPGAQKKKPAKVWTNDDFPSSPAPAPEPAPAKPAAAAQPAAEKPTNLALPVDDATAARLEKLTPEERKKRESDYSDDVKYGGQKLADLQTEEQNELDPAKVAQLRDQIKQLKDGIKASQNELDALHMLDAADASKKETPSTSGKTASPPASDENQP